MQGVVHILLVHRLHQQTDGGYHHHGIRGLDADDHIVELFATEDAQELHATLDDALGGVAIATHDAVGKRAMINADAHSGVVHLTYIDKRYEFLFYLLEFSGILLVSIFQMLKRATWVNIVTWVDTYLLAIQRSHIGRMGSEVDVGHEGRIVAVGFQADRNILHVLGLANALCGKAYQLAASIDDALGLSHRPLSIVGIGSSHRLDADGVVATNGDVAHMGHTTNSSCTHTSPLLSPCWLSQSLPSGHSYSRSGAEPEPHRSGPASRQRGWQHSEHR